MKLQFLAAIYLLALLAVIAPATVRADEVGSTGAPEVGVEGGAKVTPEAGKEVGTEAKDAFREQPITINSDRLEADDAAHQVRFVGNVVARQGDVVLYAEEMIVRYRSDTREVDRIEAYRDVRIVQGTKVATGEKGIFFREDGRIVLTGSPKVHQGKDFVEGDEITVLLNEDRSIVSSEGGSRVNAVFHPKESAQ